MGFIRVGSLTLLAALSAALLTGCWSKFELPERAFVMGVALDQREDGKIEMLTQVYRPSSTEIGKSTSTVAESSVNVKTVDDTVMEAIRDIPIHLGRKAQWSHMRIIIVGEKLARSTNILQTLDLFYRDHEPRDNVSLMIANGKAAKLFEKKPMIEQTTSQQFLRTGESSYRNAAKTLDTTLIDLMLRMKSVQTDAALAYVYEDPKSKETFSAAGLALFKKGVMKSVLPASKVEGFLMLSNDYKAGVVEIRCPGTKLEKETAEVLSLHASLNPVVKGDDVSLGIRIQGQITINEMKCTKINTLQDEEAFVRKIEEAVKRQAAGTLDFLQKRQMDAIGLGNRIYRSDPKAWARLQSNWSSRFAAIPYDIRVKIKLISGGTISSKSMS
ncbi:Ger(x)C family spore germination protein [Paenibacillus sp. LHD-117]|uniref:Ger(x)C family spore germination protein n=1 Tax=Paenibacillus sp. LHD-117 TaxID=3071412 RepID=UPI0027DFA7AC|nr:Ger(x)C family spore germination protein [Paenibacillus sp. LHD-117]MDQ6419657.1 Ger(x)C family spore germination protein [Paenibacillus sp. LHD-117]